ncbi:GmrSD restriction endonuclease domain-containing protein [Shewanella sp. 0m-8]
MKATETRLFKFLQKSAQFIIPIYQRQYSWSPDQCEQLWKDIVNAGSSELEAHFIGSVVYVERGLYSHSDVPQLLVIDGQQRLTSTTLLIAALTREIQSRIDIGDQFVVDGTNAKKLKKYYLCNDAEDGDLFYKLILTKADDQALRDIVDGKKISDEKSSLRVIQNFSFFVGKLKNQTNEQLSEVYLGLQKLIIVDIALDRERDNPQLIFESLNSTGLDLSQADLIRNYVLMGLEPKQQNQLYTDHWFPMESDFGNGEHSWMFNQFMRDYLTVKTGKPPRISDVYEGFKKYATSLDVCIAEIVADVHLHAQFYISFVRELEKNSKLLDAFKDINSYKVDVAYPLILELYHDYHFEILSADEFELCLRFIESYVFRRYVCDIPTNSLNKTFAGFSKTLKKDKYVESFKAELLKLTSYRRFPSNEEFKRYLSLKDMYNIRSRSYWLRRLENYGRKERVIVEDYTIEHVMPQNQNLSNLWKEELGEEWQRVHETYLHTIGNLTLTGYNSELSDKPFIVKRDMEGGFAQSPLKLNKSLSLLETWNEERILHRTESISETMAGVWIYPHLDDETLALYQVEEQQKSSYSLEDHPYISIGASKELYQKFRTQVLSLDESIKEEFLKLYVAFKLDTNVVDVVPQASGLRLSLNCKYTEIHDPKGLCKDVSNIGRWGNGDVELKVTQVADLPYAMILIQQVIDKQMEG